MVRESLARRFHPAGFEQPEGSRKSYVKPRRELQDAFDKWIGELGNDAYFKRPVLYQKAQKLIEPLGKIPYMEANSLLVDFKPKNSSQMDAGLFVSACHNQSPEQVIVFDLDAPKIDCIGYKFGEKRVLINNGNIGNMVGDLSSGLVVLNGKSDGYYGSYVLGTLIRMQYPENYAVLSKECQVLWPSNCERIPELKKYMGDLKDATKAIKDEESTKRFIERYGVGGEKIVPEIIEALKREASTHNRMKYWL